MGRLRLRTGLAVLTVLAVAAVLTVAAPAARVRWSRWRDRADPVVSATAVERVDGALRAEAQASIRDLVDGVAGDRAALAGARSRADRAVRRLRRLAVGTPRPVRSAVGALVADWSRRRTWRAAIDRHTVPADRALDRWQTMVAGAGAVAGASTTGPGDRTERQTIVALARARAALAAQDRTLTVVLTRAVLTPANLASVRAVPRTLAVTLDPVRPRLQAAGIPVAAFDVAHARTEPLARIARAGVVPFWTAADWQRRAAVEQARLDAIVARLAARATREERAARTDARDALRDFALLVLGAVVLVVGAGYVLHLRVRRPVRALTRAVAATAADRAAATPGTRPSALTVPPPAERAVGSVGALVVAVGRLDDATLALGAGSTRAVGTETLLIDLVHRQAPLLDRQLDLLADGDAGAAGRRELGRLTTRMRRNGDRLLVVAGLEPERRRNEAATLADIVRAAASGVEHFACVDVSNLPDDVTVDDATAGDLAHVIAELLENATTFSGGDSPVFVRGRRCPDGIELTVTDDGNGMPVARLDAYNELLTHPPMPGLDLSPTLGLVVVARLAERIGATVRLRSAPDAGTSAIVVLPDRVLVPVVHDQHPPGPPAPVPPAVVTAPPDRPGDGQPAPDRPGPIPNPAPAGALTGPPPPVDATPEARPAGVRFTAVPVVRAGDRRADAGFRPSRHRRPPTGTLHRAPAWPRAGTSPPAEDLEEDAHRPE